MEPCRGLSTPVAVVVARSICLWAMAARLRIEARATMMSSSLRCVKGAKCCGDGAPLAALEKFRQAGM
eukprot:2314001-Pleurochrysis_carterae.AAC.1